MVINVNIKYAEEELERLKYSSGYVLESMKRQLSDTPSLVIGVGGTGIGAVTQVKHNFLRDYKPADNIHFLGIDTDTAAAGDSKVLDTDSQTMLNAMDDEFFILQGAIGKGLQQNQFWSDDIKSFCPVNSGIQPGANGAGGYRVAGRYIFFENVNNLAQHLDKLVNKVTMGYNGNSAVNIFIITGIAGGTGSGTSLDLGYLLRALLHSKGYQSGVDYLITSYIILPEVNDNAKYNPWSHPNGFAYLKELNYFYSLVANNEEYQQSYGNLKYKGNDAPFDLTYFFGDSTGNQNKLKNPLKKAQTNIAESILDFMADVEDGTGKSSFIKSAASNLDNLAQSIQTNYYNKYASFGNGTIYLPEREITQYLSARLFQLLDIAASENGNASRDQLFSNQPTLDDREEVFKNLGLTLDTAMRKFEGTFDLGNKFPINGWRDLVSSNYSYENLKVDRRTLVELPLQETIIEPAQKSLVTYRRSVIEDTKTDAQTLFDAYLGEVAKGPFFISHLFGDTLVNSGQDMGVSIGKQIDYFKQSIEQTLSQAYTELSRIKEERDNILNQKPKSKLNPFDKGMTKEEIATRYIELAIEATEKEKDTIGYEAIKNVLDTIKGDLENLYNIRYGRVSHILNELKLIGQSYLAEVEDGKLEEETTFVTFADIRESLESNLIANVESNLDNYKRSFSGRIKTEVDKLVSDNSVAIIDFLHDYLEKELVNSNFGLEFLNVLKWAANAQDNPNNKTLSFDKASQLISDNINLTSFLQKNVVQTLDNNAKPQLNLTSNYSNQLGTVNSEGKLKDALLPRDLKADVDPILGQNGYQVKDDERKDRIVSYQFVTGFPLYMLANLKKYETEYEDAIAAGDSYAKSLHLYCTEDLWYKDLPSFIPTDERTVGTSVPRVDQERAERDQLFKECVEAGIITEANGQVQIRLSDRTINLQGGSIESGKPLIHFHQLFTTIPEIKKSLQVKQAQSRAKQLFHLLVLDFVVQKPGTMNYELAYEGTTIPLANLIDKEKSDYREFYLQEALESKLTDQQKELIYPKLSGLIGELTSEAEGVSHYQKIREELNDRVKEVKNKILFDNPSNASELTSFYDSLGNV